MKTHPLPAIRGIAGQERLTPALSSRVNVSNSHFARLHLVNTLSILMIFVAMVIAACDRQATSPPQFKGEDTVRRFTGRWTATGNRQVMDLGSEHYAATFRLTGSLLLEGEQRLKRGFYSDLIGFLDNRTGMLGRSVWTDERGDRIFSELRGGPDLTTTEIKGTFLGGTGRYANVTGEYTFKWKRVTINQSNEVSGRVVDFQGWARLGSPDGP